MSDLKIDNDTGFLDPTPDELTEEGAEAVGQRLRIRLRLFKGESEFFPDDGVDWIRFVLGQKFYPSRLNTAFVPEIRKTPGVAEITADLKYTIDRRLHKLGVTVEVRTTTGEDVVAEV